MPMMARRHHRQSGKGGSNVSHLHEQEGLRERSFDVKDGDDEEYASNPTIFVVLTGGIVCSRTPPTWSMSKVKGRALQKYF